MKRFVLFLAVCYAAAACTGDPAPTGLVRPEISEVVVEAMQTGAHVTFKVTGDADRCGVDVSGPYQGSSTLRFIGELEDGSAGITVTGLSAETAYSLTPWAGNDSFEIRGEGLSFNTLEIPELRIFNLVCSSITNSSANVSFRYTEPQRVQYAGCWCYLADGGSPADESAIRLIVPASPMGDISLIVSGLKENTAYEVLPFVNEGNGEILGTSQRFTTIGSDAEITLEEVELNEDFPHNIAFSFYLLNYWGVVTPYLYIQEGNRISFDENTMLYQGNANPNNGNGSRSLNYMFAKSGCEYTVLPFVRLQQEEVEVYGEPITFTTPSHINSGSCYLIETEDGPKPWDAQENIPDPSFRAYVMDNFDTNHDGVLDDDEANGVFRIDCRNLGIKSLKGIERFENIQYVNCSGNPVSEIDLGGDFYIRKPQSYHLYSLHLQFLKEFIALDMNDAEGNNVLKKIFIYNSSATVSVPEGCIVVAK